MTTVKRGYVDTLAEEYDGLLKAVAAARAQAEEFRRHHIEPLLAEHGEPHAKKSRIVQGDEWEIVEWTGDQVEVDQVAVAALYARLAKLRAHALFKKLFKLVVRYDVADTANSIVYARELPPSAPANLRQMFCEAVHIEKGSPRITVRRLRKQGGV